MSVKEVFGQNIKEIRQIRGQTQKVFGLSLGMSESQIRAWESGKTDVRISTVEQVAKKLEMPIFTLLEPHITARKEKPKPERPYDFDMRIYSMEDRLTVIGILAKNGYDVGQHKRQRTPTGKVLDYYVHAKLLEGNADTSK